MINKKAIWWGAGASVVMIIFYAVTLTLANSWAHTVEQFLALWFWLLILVVGVGVQIGLFVEMRARLREKQLKTHSREVALSTGISTGAMIACCAHHLVDVVPILGFSAAFALLAQYQNMFIMLGVVTSILGIINMLAIMQKQELLTRDGLLDALAKYDLQIFRKVAVIVGIVFIPIYGWFFSMQNIINKPALDVTENSGPTPQNTTSLITLPVQTNEAGGLSIDAQPLPFMWGDPINISVSLTTHEGDLNINWPTQAVLVDDQQREYSAQEWQGGNGGHHLQGTLVFSAITQSTTTLTLLIRDVYNTPERRFEWVII